MLRWPFNLQIIQLDFNPPEVVDHWREPQIQVGERNSFNLRLNGYKSWRLNTHLVPNTICIFS